MYCMIFVLTCMELFKKHETALNLFLFVAQKINQKYLWVKDALRLFS